MASFMSIFTAGPTGYFYAEAHQLDKAHQSPSSHEDAGSAVRRLERLSLSSPA